MNKITGQFDIQKSDQDKRLVFGWASVAVRRSGEQIIDYQGDMFDPEDLEMTAYNYVLNFRDAGEEHIPSLRKKGKLVESVVFTKEKLRALGLPEDALPQGWWIGFKVYDDDAWEKIKNGTYKMFSIEGTGIREKVNEEDLMKKKAGSFTFAELLEKFNPYHDKAGRFATANGAASFTFRTKDPSKQHWATNAIEREKERTKDWDSAPSNNSTTLAGVKRGDPMTHEQANEGNVNPNYGKASGYSTNCQSCVVTYEARLRGYDVKTLPNNNEHTKSLSRDTDLAWIDPKTGKKAERIDCDVTMTTAKKTRQWLEDTVKPGERYNLRHGWKGRKYNGHIISVDRDSDGSLRLYDPQSGKTYKGEEIHSYLTRMKNVITIKDYYGSTKLPRTSLTRVDDKEFNLDIVNHIMEAS